MDHFEHEKLDVYKAAIEFVALVNELAERLPRGRGQIGDQLWRASNSVALNIAEGAGEFAPAEKARFYRIARRSATECAASLDVCRIRGIIEPAALGAGRDRLLRIVAMLTRMVLNCTEKGG